MQFKAILFINLFLLFTFTILAQDSLFNQQINEVLIQSKKAVPSRLSDTESNQIYSGKKNEVLSLTNLNVNLTTNQTRQIFARVPGLSLWENDGTGAQVSIALRGLNPNRSWELNTRQNGYDISSDIFGYPEAYYNPAMEAVDKIELIRGGSALQFGPQFGGLVNYVLKREKRNKKLSFESQNSFGSNNMFSTFNAVGGNLLHWSYYVYNHYRKGNTTRENSEFTLSNTHAFIQYKWSPKNKLSFEYTNMVSLIQQSGGLTDQQWKEDPKQSFRSRNWMNLPWNLASLHYENAVNQNLSHSIKVFGLLGNRSSIGYLATPNIMDTINMQTQTFNNRQVDKDAYKNIGLEYRAKWQYNTGKIKHTLAFGTRVYQANITRRQRGMGDTGSEYNSDIILEKFPTELSFKTNNIALFAENTITINKSLKLTPGLRLESIVSEVKGKFNSSIPQNETEYNGTKKRTIPLFGIGLEYKIKATNFYGNISQAYRPVLFSEITTANSTDVIDPDLKDASGYNAELGYRGLVSDYLNFDISIFYLKYNNKIGTIRKFISDDPSQNTYQFRTNLGHAIHKGIEAYIDLDILKLCNPKHKSIFDLSVFVSSSFIDAKYLDFRINSVSGSAPNIQIKEINLKGNRVEYAPEFIHSFGILVGAKGISLSLQSRITSDIFTDANNTENSNQSATTGKIKQYVLHDASMEYHFLKYYNLKLNVNNFTNTKYATRRANSYPGPGLIPGDATTFNIGIGVKF